MSTLNSCSIRLLVRSFNKMKIDTIQNRTLIKTPRFRPPYWYTTKERVKSEDFLTPENEQFLEEVKQDKLKSQAILTSPLIREDLEPLAKWDRYTRRAGLIARKIGNYPMWTKDGKKVQTTLLQVHDNHVIKYTPPEEFKPMKVTEVNWREKRRLGCLLIGSETIDPSSVTRDYCGLFDRVGMLPKKHLCRFMISPHAVIPTGTPLFATHFRVGDYLDVRSKTMDRGFQGVMKRWGFKGMPASHGVTKTHRRPGNIGSGGQKARVWPGTKMPGHMGNRWRILRGVKILRIDTKHNVLWVLGVGIPGETGAMCYLFDTVLPRRKHQSAPPFPTQPEVDGLPNEYYDESIHPFEQNTITYEEV